MTYFNFTYHGGLPEGTHAAILAAFQGEMLAEEGYPTEACPHGFAIHIGLPSDPPQGIHTPHPDFPAPNWSLVGYVYDLEPNGFGVQRMFWQRSTLTLDFEAV